MLTHRKPKPAPPVATTSAKRCQACGATDAPLEHLAVALETVVDRCVDPVACRERAQRAGEWKTYNP